MILGGGPNRIGQGIEFDYCCCHASFALRELGIESIMVNSNPETVSTDYDTSDLLFFEPLTTEDVLNICDRVQPDGVIVQFGGQTPLNLARALSQRRRADHRHERRHDRRRRGPREVRATCCDRLGLKQPANGIARTMAQARARSRRRSAIPVLVRPSFVLGGRAMEICYDDAQFERFVAEAFIVAQGQPVLIDRFLEDATEVDVDAIGDGERRDRGRHHGAHRRGGRPLGRLGLRDSAVQPARPGGGGDPRGDLRHGPRAARSVGLMNVQFAVKQRRRPADGLRARSQPAGQPHRAVRVEGDRRAAGQGRGQGDGRRVAGRAGLSPTTRSRSHVSVKESVFPFVKFAGVDIVLGPEMRSTGEVMGISERFSIAFAKSQLAAGTVLPDARQDLHQRGRPGQGAHRRPGRGGWSRWASSCWPPRARPAAGGRPASRCSTIKKIQEGHPNLLDYMVDGDLQLVINTPSGKGARTDEGRIRAAAVSHGVPCITTIQAADAAVRAMEALREEELEVQAVQDRFPTGEKTAAV